MTRRIRALNQGRYRVWSLTRSRRGDLVIAAQVLFVVAAFLAVSTWDYRDQLAHERYAKADVQRMLDEEKAARAAPPTFWLVEAKTPEAAQEKLAQISGQIDKEREKMKGLVPR